MQFALGKLGWSPFEYWTAMPAELWMAFIGYQEKVKEQMMIVRHSTYLIMCATAGSKEIGNKFESMWPLDDAKPREIKQYSEDDKRALIDKFKKRVNRGKRRPEV